MNNLIAQLRTVAGLPAVSLIHEFLEFSDPWIVGSMARKLSGEYMFAPPGDIDVLLEHTTAGVLRHFVQTNYGNIRRNGFGGYRLPFASGIKHADVWMDNVADYLKEVPLPKHGIALHVRTGTVLYTREYVVQKETCEHPIQTRITRTEGLNAKQRIGRREWRSMNRISGSNSPKRRKITRTPKQSSGRG